MSYIYIITIIFLIVIFMLIKKSNKELNGLGIFGLGIILILCYNVLQCYVLNFFKIGLSLLNLSIVNFIIIIIGTVYLLKKKEIQKYVVNLRDLIYSFLIGMVVIVIGCIQYGSPLDIKYETTDPATHYRAAYDFATSEHLTNISKDKLWGFENFKIASYINSGIIMKIFANTMDEFDYYKIFIIFGLFVLFMTGFIMYLAFIKISKGRLSILAFVCSVLFLLGYPLNSLNFGFEYMSMGILMITVLLYAVSYYTNKEIEFKQILIILFLINFQLFQAYYQFIPYIYSALFIYICMVNYKEDKKIFSKKNIITLVITLIIPFILGYLYYMASNIYNMNVDISSTIDSLEKQKGLLSSFNIYGYVYNNLYSNILLFLPLVIYVFIKERKNIGFSSILVIFTIGYIVLLLVGNFNDLVSDYYVTKNYFALWVILWYISFKAICYLYEKYKVVPYILIIIYISIIIFTLNFDASGIENKLKNYKLSSVTEIYKVNNYLVRDSKKVFYEYELDIMKYAKQNLDKSKKIELLGSERQIIWAYPLLDYYYEYPEMKEKWYHQKLTYKHKNDKIIENADYIICFYRSDFYREYDITKLENMEIVYENVFGKIYKAM